jgi:hypothetical protein
VTYLRFTPQEFQAIQHVCHSVKLSDESFAVFRYFLVETLDRALPGLINRLARLPARKLRILFESLRDHKRCVVKNHGGGTKKDGRKHALTVEEMQAVRQASGLFFLFDGSQYSFQDYLVYAFIKTMPALAAKLARFSHQQIARLYHQAKERHRWAP